MSTKGKVEDSRMIETMVTNVTPRGEHPRYLAGRWATLRATQSILAGIQPGTNCARVRLAGAAPPIIGPEARAQTARYT